MKSVAGTLKLDLAQFRELEAFSTFGSELDAVSRAQLDRGERLVELLKQPLNSPMPVEEQVVSIYVGTAGLLDDIDSSDVRQFEQELLEFMRGRHAGLLAEIRETGAMPEGGALENACAEFKRHFLELHGGGDVDPTEHPGEAELPHDPTTPETLETE
jgi:F-type H+/Na+-transporting ATPase subunit alpha